VRDSFLRFYVSVRDRVFATGRSFRKSMLTATASIIFAAGLALVLVQAWRAQDGVERTCEKSVPGREDFSYVQLSPTKQEATGPGFKGSLYIYLGGRPVPNPLSVTISGDQGYLDSLYNSKTSTEEIFGEDFDDVVIIPSSGSHRNFPFDSAHFNLRLEIDPKIDISTLRIANWVPGFVFDCDTMRVSISADNIKIQFSLYRNPLVQLAAIVLTIAAVAFAVLIFRSKSTEAISGATASSFFSLWSVRSILSSQIQTFPTLLDLAMLTMSIVLLAAVFWRVAVGFRSSSDVNS